MANARPAFEPGFRISVADGFVLSAGVLLVAWAAPREPLLAGITVFVIAHFFLFCNVFRIPRLPELVWAGTFSGLALVTATAGFPGWPLTFVSVAVLGAVLILRELRQPAYHGVGWRRINPGLEAWWRARQREAPGRFGGAVAPTTGTDEASSGQAPALNRQTDPGDG